MVERNGRWSVIAVVFALFLLVSIAAVGVAAPSMGGPGESGDSMLSGDSDIKSFDSTDELDEAEFDGEETVEINGVTVGSVLQEHLEEKDEVEMFIRLDSVDVPADIKDGGRESVINHLKTQSATSQQPVLNELESESNVTVVTTFWIANAILVNVETKDRGIEETLEMITQLPHVRRLHANLRAGTDSATQNPEGIIANDETMVNNSVEQESTSSGTSNYIWSAEQINVPKVHERIPTKGEGVDVVVLDSGIDTDHEDLELDEWADFDGDGGEYNTDPFDSGYHGTHVSGIIAGDGTIGGKYYGIAPEVNLNVGQVQIINGSGQREYEQAAIIQGIEWAADEVSADVLTMSLGASGKLPIFGYKTAFIEPIQNAEDAGVVVVASSGNEGEGSSSTPGNEYDSIGVGATTEFENIPGFSSGEELGCGDFYAVGCGGNDHWPDDGWVTPSIVAPGKAIESTIPTNYNQDYAIVSGTSQATPHVAGVASLLLSMDDENNFGPDSIEELLQETAKMPNENEPNFQITDVDFEDPVDGTHTITVEIENTGETAIGNVVYEFFDDGIIFDDWRKVEDDSWSSVIIDGGGQKTVDIPVDDPSFTSGNVDVRVRVLDVPQTVDTDTDGNKVIPVDEWHDVEEETITVNDILGENDSIDAAEEITEPSTDENTNQEPSTRYGHGIIDAFGAIASKLEADVADVEVGTEGPFLQGDTVDATLKVENTGELTNKFFVSHSVFDSDGNKYNNDGETGTTVELEPGESQVVSVPWVVEDQDGGEVPLGTYDSEIAVWVESDRDNLHNRLETVEIEDAFEVTEEDSGLTQPSNPSPPSSETQVSTSLSLSWDASTSEDGPITYDVFFGTSQSPPLYTTTTDTSVEVDGLQDGTTYYWRVIADDGDQTADSPVWWFTTVDLDGGVSIENLEFLNNNQDGPLAIQGGAYSDLDEGYLEYDVLTDDGRDYDIRVINDRGIVVGVDTEDAYGNSEAVHLDMDEGDGSIFRTIGTHPAEVIVYDHETGTQTQISTTTDIGVDHDDGYSPDMTVLPVNPQPGEEVTVDVGHFSEDSAGNPIDGYEWYVVNQDTGDVIVEFSDPDQDKISFTPPDPGEYYISVSNTGSNYVIDSDEPHFESGIPEPSLSVDDFSVPSSVISGETISATVELTNSGDATANYIIRFKANGNVHEVEAAQEDPDDSRSESGDLSLPVGTHDVTAEVIDSHNNIQTFTETVEVIENTPPTEPSLNSPSDGATGISRQPTLDWSASDPDGGALTYIVKLEKGDPTPEKNIATGLSDSSIDVSELDYNSTYYWRIVATDEHGGTTTGPIWQFTTKPNPIMIDIAGTNSPVEENNPISVDIDIENTGDETVTQTVELDVEGLGTNSTEIAIGGGESITESLSVSTGDGDAGTYTAEVASGDDSASTSVTVNEPPDPPNFEVSIDSTNAPISAGENLLVTATIGNTGDKSGIQTVTLNVSGLGSDSTLLLLSGSDWTQETFSVGTSNDDVGTYTAEVSSANDSASSSVTINEPSPPNFEVSINATNGPITAGETLTVNATIENTGDKSGNQTVTLNVSGLGSDSTSVGLSGGDSTQETFSVGTSSGEAGNYTAEVSSANDSASTSVTVEEQPDPPNFEVGINATNAPVVAGETLSVQAAVENTGEVKDTQTVTLDVGTLGNTSTSVAIDGGESTNVTLSVATNSGDTGSYTATVSSENDTDTANVTVLTPVNFTVGIVETNTPVEGEDLNVTAGIENTGDVEGTQTIELDVGALGGDATTVTLGGGNATDVTLSVGTNSGDAGSHTATVSSENDTDSANVTVLSESNFAVNITKTNSPVVEGNTLSVDATVKNTGDVSGTQTITLDVGAIGSDSTSVSLAGGALTNVTLSVGTSSGDAGDYTATISSEDDSDSTSVIVLAEANFAVNVTETNSPIVENETLWVDAIIKNTGDAGDTQTITLDVGELGANSTEVTLAGNASTEEMLTVPTEAGNAGTYTVTVESENDADTTEVTVNEPADFEIVGVETNAPIVGGEELTMTVTVENTGSGFGTALLEVDGGTLGTSGTEISLDGGNTTEVTLTLDTEGKQVGTYNVTVSIADETFETAVDLQLPTPPGSESPPQDLGGDGLYEDIDGSGEFTIFDVQTLFNSLSSGILDDHAWAFNFNEDENPVEVTIFDVQSLFNLLSKG